MGSVNRLLRSVVGPHGLVVPFSLRKCCGLLTLGAGLLLPSCGPRNSCIVPPSFQPSAREAAEPPTFGSVDRRSIQLELRAPAYGVAPERNGREHCGEPTGIRPLTYALRTHRSPGELRPRVTDTSTIFYGACAACLAGKIQVGVRKEATSGTFA
jgi:hypothetical protein